MRLFTMMKCMRKMMRDYIPNEDQKVNKVDEEEEEPVW